MPRSLVPPLNAARQHTRREAWPVGPIWGRWTSARQRGRTEGAGTISQTDFGYTGQRDLPDLGLMDYKARFYDDALARFTQPDTIVLNIEDPQDWNRYSYVRNDPVYFTDPSGHCTLLDSEADGFCFIITHQPNLGAASDPNEAPDLISLGMQIVHGGDLFPNEVAFDAANYLLTTNAGWLAPVLQSPALGLVWADVVHELGYQVPWQNQMPGEWVILAAAVGPPDFGGDDYAYESMRGLDAILAKDDVEFLRWARKAHPINEPYSATDAGKIWLRLKSAGLQPVLDAPHAGRTFDLPHINVRGQNIHIPVEPGFVPP